MNILVKYVEKLWKDVLQQVNLPVLNVKEREISTILFVGENGVKNRFYPLQNNINSHFYSCSCSHKISIHRFQAVYVITRIHVRARLEHTWESLHEACIVQRHRYTFGPYRIARGGTCGRTPPRSFVRQRGHF